tara:strand:- start:50 stop:430 length:381 start_codon:yes stop_codon:yes gene_type:complete
MPKANTIHPEKAAPPVLTSAEQNAERLIIDSDLALLRLAESIRTGFELLWGTRENPKSKEDVQAIVDALGDNRVELFTRHAAIVAALTTGDLATFEPWETVPAYATPTVGTELGELAPEWSPVTVD